MKDDTWPWLISVVKRFFHEDPLLMTYSTFLAHLKNIPKLRKWEAGEDVNDEKAGTKKLSPDEFLQAVLAGDLKPDALKPSPVSITPEEKAKEQRRIEALLQPKPLNLPPRYRSA